MDKLYENAVSSDYKDMLIIEDGKHMTSWSTGGDKYFSKLNEFIGIAY